MSVRGKFIVLALMGAVSIGGTPLRAASSTFGPNFFGRTPLQFFNLAGFGRNFDLTFGFPQDVAGFSRLSTPRVAVSRAEPQRRILIRDPRSGFVNREVRLNGFGFLESRPANAFGIGFGFFSAGGLDVEAAKQASKFFLESNDLGSFNNAADLFNGRVNFADVFAANALAARTMGPDLTRGTVRIQCLKDDNYGRPTDLLAGQLSTDEAGTKVDESYLKYDWIDRCMKLMSYTLNNLVDPFHPPIPFNRNMIDPNTGILTINNLRNHFSLRDLAVVFNRANNTDVCNFEPAPANPIWSTEDVVRTAHDPKIVNTVKGYDPDDVNRNFFLMAGVNLALPQQLLGRVGAPLTDHFFINNRKSGVATSGQEREMAAFANAGVQFFTTFDTNAGKSAVQAASQNVRQAGRNNLGVGQAETLIYDQYGRMHHVLSAAPDDQGRLKLAEEAPATAAHAGDRNGVLTGMCHKCHKNGPALLDQQGGPYDILPVAGTSGIANLSANFTNARAKYQSFIRMINADMWDAKKPNSLVSPAWDALVRSNLPKSTAYVSGLLGYPPNAVDELLRRLPQVGGPLLVDQNGNLDAKNLASGGKCFLKAQLKRQFGDPSRFQAAQAALASTPAAGGQTHAPGAR